MAAKLQDGQKSLLIEPTDRYVGDYEVKMTVQNGNETLIVYGHYLQPLIWAMLKDALAAYARGDTRFFVIASSDLEFDVEKIQGGGMLEQVAGFADLEVRIYCDVDRGPLSMLFRIQALGKEYLDFGRPNRNTSSLYELTLNPTLIDLKAFVEELLSIVE